MERSSPFDGIRGVILIAATYVYFLIFAQFGFLKRLDAAGITGDSLQPIMAAMAAGGILASLIAARRPSSTATRRLQLALLGCAAAAGLALLSLSRVGFVGASLLIGLSLGTLTVTLVANLPLWMGTRHPLLKVGLGTGLGYLVCNFPPLFTASPRSIALSAIGASLLGLIATWGTSSRAADIPTVRSLQQPIVFALVLVWFTVLVWFDSAAFFIIQNSPALKSGTWEGAAHLWRTGGVHLLAALAAVALLARRGLGATLLLAFASLAGACLLLLDSLRSAPASILYPAGVSLYSVALVAYPSFLMPSASQEQRSRRAGWIYAVAGWIGSAMGIGMAQHLHRIPVCFVAVAVTLFALPVAWQFRRQYWREAVAVLAVLAAAWGIEHLLSPHPAAPPSAGIASAVSASPVERGRRVYISEGCINCHSQYVRPHSHDVELWGPAGNLEAIRREKPPLIGNRRQGPDLSEVGSRRSPLWLRMHLIDPRAVSYGSIMPSYAYLFRDRRGDDLVAYLESLKNPDSAAHLKEAAASWQPSVAARTQASRLNRAALFREYCATCHEPSGAARIRWDSDFKHVPPNLATARLSDIPPNASPEQLRSHLARIIKFGMPGTDMPGHEYLPDTQIEALAEYVATLRR